MTDEKYTFVEDCREKKRTATGAFHKRTHAGKGGRVRFPSDYKTKKELRAMNGEVHSYKLNRPMKWEEFKSMPDDLKVDYIKGLRKSFGVPDVRIAEMFEVSGSTVTLLCKKLNISNGQGKGARVKWNKEAFEVWCNGCKDAEKAETIGDDEDIRDYVAENEANVNKTKKLAEAFRNIGEASFMSYQEFEELKTKLDECCAKAMEDTIVPYNGHMTFDECTIDQAADMVRKIIGDKKVGLTISWTFERGED